MEVTFLERFPPTHNLSDMNSDILLGTLSDMYIYIYTIQANILTYILTFYLTQILTFYLTQILTSYLTFYVAFYLTFDTLSHIYSDFLSGVLSEILSDIYTGHYIWYLIH